MISKKEVLVWIKSTGGLQWFMSLGLEVACFWKSCAPQCERVCRGPV